MKWDDIERSAKEHQAVLDEERRREKETREQRSLEFKATLERQLDEKRAAAKEIFDRLHVEEALEEIKGRFWKEGTIEKVEKVDYNNTLERFGFRLASDPYPVLRVRDTGRKTQVVREQEQSILEIVQDPKLFTNGQPGISLRDTGLYDLKELSGDRRRHSRVAKEISEHGLENGLYLTLHGLHHGVNSNMAVSLQDPDQDLEPRFNAILVDIVNDRNNYRSRPGEIRAWQKDLVAQFPPTLKDEGSLGGRELREWGHKLMGSSRAVVLFERVKDLAFDL